MRWVCTVVLLATSLDIAVALLVACGCVALRLHYIVCVWSLGWGWGVVSVFCVGMECCVEVVVSVEGEGVLAESATSAFVYTGLRVRS